MARIIQSLTTTDHDEIRRWVEERGGRPAVKTGDDSDAELLRIEFPGEGESSLQAISWEDFFQRFDRDKLAFTHQDITASGAPSTFFKLVSREPQPERRELRRRPFGGRHHRRGGAREQHRRN